MLKADVIGPRGGRSRTPIMAIIWTLNNGGVGVDENLDARAGEQSARSES
jgi:hypothetical protein